MRIIESIRSSTSAWTLIFGFSLAVQIYRWSIPDIAIFGTFTFLLIIDSLNVIHGFKGIKVRRLFSSIFVLLSAIYLYIAKRQDTLLAIFFILLGGIILLAIWRNKDGRQKLNKREFKSAISWSAFAFVLGMWEFLALLFSNIAHNKKAFPTISEIVIPRLSDNFDKAQFILIWLAIGYYFFNRWRAHE
jgi:hypothetical protein